MDGRLVGSLVGARSCLPLEKTKDLSCSALGAEFDLCTTPFRPKWGYLGTERLERWFHIVWEFEVKEEARALLASPVKSYQGCVMLRSSHACFSIIGQVDAWLSSGSARAWDLGSAPESTLLP